MNLHFIKRKHFLELSAIKSLARSIPQVATILIESECRLHDFSTKKNRFQRTDPVLHSRISKRSHHVNFAHWYTGRLFKTSYLYTIQIQTIQFNAILDILWLFYIFIYKEVKCQLYRIIILSDGYCNWIYSQWWFMLSTSVCLNCMDLYA